MSSYITMFEFQLLGRSVLAFAGMHSVVTECTLVPMLLVLFKISVVFLAVTLDVHALSVQNAKFGFGGKKRGVKRNTSASSADMSAFKPSLHSQSSSAKRRKVATKRPGKGRRAKMRQRKGKR